MNTLVAKKTFSIKSNIVMELNNYNNKSKFVNEALSFYIDYLNSFKKYKENFLEKKIQEALNGDFYEIELSKNSNKNTIKYVSHSKELEDNLMLAINN